MRSELESKLDALIANGALGQDFSFRPGQRETVLALAELYFEEPDATVVIDAPTGTGKSIIAMATAKLLTEFSKTGYLITSDIALQDQYESDMYRRKIRWPSLKGVDNYECSVNQQPFSIGDCKLKGMSYEQAKNLHCYQTCDYLQLRNRAIHSPVVVFNYSYWLLQRNYVESRLGENNPFDQRDFVFFDEAHKVDEIVQGHFSPRIDEGILERTKRLNSFISRYTLPPVSMSQTALTDLVVDLIAVKNANQAFDMLKLLDSVLLEYRAAGQLATQQAKQLFKSGTVPAAWQRAFTDFDRLKDVHCKIEDYVRLINQVGLAKMVIDHKPAEVQFFCVEEAQMIRQYLHAKAGFKVFMSATIGDPATYMKIMGIQNARFIRLQNGFDYTKSPIVFVNKYSMAMKSREANFGNVLELLDRIIAKHISQRGIIHSGSYEFTRLIMQHSQYADRLLDYADSKQKAKSLEVFKKSDDKILIGPSILEGLDLKDDFSRFQVFFKVPFPSLGDALVKAKLQHSQDWYDWKTSISILQGVGRSVRSQEDWAVTYILDASFSGLLGRGNLIPPDFKERMKVIK